MGATATVELYYTAQADGDGYAESAESDTATTGFDIRRKLYYAESAQSDPDTGTWVQFADIADDTTFASAKATLLAYLKARTGGTVPISLKMTWEEVSEYTPLLDTYTGAAAAYSLRQLRTGETQAIRVRRASDNTEQDIGFDGSGELDTTALATFCGSSDGFVRTFFDQSGNGRDFAQGSTAEQPKIYDGTTGIVTDNAKPAMQFDGANDNFNSTSALTNDTNFFGAVVMSVSGGSAMFLVYDSNNAGRLGLVYYAGVSTSYTPELWSGFNRESSGQSISINTQTIITSHKSGTQAECFANGQSNGASTVNDPTTSMGGLSFGRYANNYFTGKLQEIIFYGDDQSSDRANIETNLNDFYSAF